MWEVAGAHITFQREVAYSSSDEDSGSSSFIDVDEERAIALSFAQASGELPSGTRLMALFWLRTSALELEKELELELGDGTLLLALGEEDLKIDMPVRLPCTSFFGLLFDADVDLLAFSLARRSDIRLWAFALCTFFLSDM